MIDVTKMSRNHIPVAAVVAEVAERVVVVIIVELGTMPALVVAVVGCSVMAVGKNRRQNFIRQKSL